MLRRVYMYELRIHQSLSGALEKDLLAKIPGISGIFHVKNGLQQLPVTYVRDEAMTDDHILYRSCALRDPKTRAVLSTPCKPSSRACNYI